jgi:hypothetical protein
MNNEPGIDYLLENQDKLVHKYYQKELDAKVNIEKTAKDEHH